MSARMKESNFTISGLDIRGFSFLVQSICQGVNKAGAFITSGGISKEEEEGAKVGVGGGWILIDN